MKIIYSFNKTGFEAEMYEANIRKASDDRFDFIPFNHGQFLDPRNYLDAVALDRLYQARHPSLVAMYQALQRLIAETGAAALIAFNCPPYHPDFLRTLAVYKVLYSGDDPGSTYIRNIPYQHAYDHLFYANPGYSRDMDMAEKMRYCGVKNADFVPIGVMEGAYDPGISEADLFQRPRDIDVIYVGAFYQQKLSLLAKLKRALGKRFQVYGFFRFSHNLFFIFRHGFPGWVFPVTFPERVRLHQRAKIGINIHWNEFNLGNERTYYLPANGVMQICDCAPLHSRLFPEPGEIVGYSGFNDLLQKIRYYLDHEEERLAIARAGFRRVIGEYRFVEITRKAARKIVDGMDRIDFSLSRSVPVWHP